MYLEIVKVSFSESSAVEVERGLELEVEDDDEALIEAGLDGVEGEEKIRE